MPDDHSLEPYDPRSIARELEATLGEIFCLTFVKGVDETEALLRMGAVEDTLRPRTLADLGDEIYSYDAGYPMVAQAARLKDWTVVIEPSGFEGSDAQLLEAVSYGTEAVSVLRHDYASDSFGYAVDGALLTGFDPSYPESRWGSEPDHLAGLMQELLREEDDPRLTSVDDNAAALDIIGRLTGVMVEPEALRAELPSAYVEPWFSKADPSVVNRPKNDAQLAAALDSASPSVRRTVVVREVRHLTEALQVADTPGLSEALAAAEQGNEVRVTSGSDLGQAIRTWLADSRRAGNSLNDHSARHRMTEDERTRAFHLGWLAGAVRGALWSSSITSAYEALRPLTRGPAPLADPVRRTEVLNALRS